MGSALFLVIGIDAIRGGVTGRSFLGSLVTRLGGPYPISSGRWIGAGIAALTLSLCLGILSVRKLKAKALILLSPRRKDGAVPT
jgi:hypothetical protein